MFMYIGAAIFYKHSIGSSVYMRAHPHDPAFKLKDVDGSANKVNTEKSMSRFGHFVIK